MCGHFLQTDPTVRDSPRSDATDLLDRPWHRYLCSQPIQREPIMSVRIRGHEVSAEVRPIRNGFFLRAAIHAAFGLQAGSIVEVNGATCVVKFLIPGDPCEPETWAILMPVRRAIDTADTVISV